MRFVLEYKHQPRSLGGTNRAAAKAVSYGGAVTPHNAHNAEYATRYTKRAIQNAHYKTRYTQRATHTALHTTRYTQRAIRNAQHIPVAELVERIDVHCSILKHETKEVLSAAARQRDGAGRKGGKGRERRGGGEGRHPGMEGRGSDHRWKPYTTPHRDSKYTMQPIQAMRLIQAKRPSCNPPMSCSNPAYPLGSSWHLKRIRSSCCCPATLAALHGRLAVPRLCKSEPGGSCENPLPMCPP